MKPLTEYLSTQVKSTKLVPKTGTELRKMIVDEINRLGFTANFNHIDVSNIEDFDNVFYASYSFALFNGDVSEWNVSKMKHCKFMFSCTHFDGDLSQWDVSNCEDFSSMFNTTSHFTGKGLEYWNIKNAKTTEYMFHKTYSFDGESVRNWKLPAKIEHTNAMFKNACELQADFSKWNVSKIRLQDRLEMFDYCPKMIVEWLPKGINPNDVKLYANTQAISELRKFYHKVEEDLI